MTLRLLALSVAAIAAVVFGLLTILAGGRVLFGGADMGAVVPFVLWFNFLAGFAYVAAGLGLWRERLWASRLAVAILVATLLVLLGLALHVAAGRPYEARTVGAMLLRSAVWAVIVLIARRRIGRH